MPDDTPQTQLFQPLTLPNGQVIPNRIGKASMEENMAEGGQLPGPALLELYRQWGAGGSGLILTGNVMVAPDAVTGPGGVVLDERQPLEPFRDWARAGQAQGARMWMQINHPGRQVFARTNPEAIAPSAVPVDMGRLSSMFTRPRAMTEDDIARVIRQFATAAALAEKAGFDGVEIHAAHGYLLSQFLSPLTNRRDDQWGGSLENRARLLIEVVRATRDRVSAGFAVGVKLNSADFQKGGFDADDAAAVVRLLNAEAVDLVEISGGSYESPAMQGRAKEQPKRASTRRREAYFLDFALDIVAVAQMPIMVTGGIRSRAAAEDALAPEDGRPGVAMVGLAQALAYAPDLPNRWKRAEDVIDVPRVDWKGGVGSTTNLALTKLQLQRMGRGQNPTFAAWAPGVLVRDQLRTLGLNRSYRRWLEART